MEKIVKKKIQNCYANSWEESGLLEGLAEASKKELVPIFNKADKALTKFIYRVNGAGDSRMRSVFPIIRRVHNENISRLKLYRNLENPDTLNFSMALIKNINVEELIKGLYELLPILDSGKHFKSFDWNNEVITLYAKEYAYNLYVKTQEELNPKK